MADSSIVIDLGSKDIKAGYIYAWPNEQEPRLVTPSAATVAGAPDPVRCIVAGEIVNWPVLETLLHFSIYTQLGWVEGAEGGVLVVEPPFTPRRDRETLTQLMFEVFNVSGYFATDSAVASLASVGKMAGVVVDVGYEKIDVMPVLDGVLQGSAAARLPFGGAHLTRHMQELLQKKGIAVTDEVAEGIKLSAMRMAPFVGAADAAEGAAAANGAAQKAEPKTYTLPDGQTIAVDAEGLELGEKLLTPSLMGFNTAPLAETVRTAALITTVVGEREARKTLADNILVCGGGSAVPGLPQRLLAEVSALSTHPTLSPGLCQPPEYLPQHTAARAAWMGGSVMAKTSLAPATVPGMLQHPMTKADYDEVGPSMIHRKCT